MFDLTVKSESAGSCFVGWLNSAAAAAFPFFTLDFVVRCFRCFGVCHSRAAADNDAVNQLVAKEGEEG